MKQLCRLVINWWKIFTMWRKARYLSYIARFLSVWEREQFAITSRMSVTLSESMTRVSSRTGRRKDGLSLIIWDIEWCQLQLCPSKTLTRKKECHGNRETSDQDTDIFFQSFYFGDYYHSSLQFYLFSRRLKPMCIASIIFMQR